MSGKRRATSDINRDNWDTEIEPEKRGTFLTAPEEELKSRVIRKAHRKLAGTSDTKPEDAADGQNKSVFSGFSGFGKTTSSATTASNFSNLSSTNSAFSSGSDKKADDAKPSSMFSFLNKFTQNSTTDSKKETSPESSLAQGSQVASTNNNNYNFSKSNTYYAKLKGLNQAVSSWIKTHVDKNPLCLLSPIFKDYEKYLAEIEKSEGTATISEGGNQSQAMNDFKFSTTPAQVPSTMFSFGNKNNSDTTDKGSDTKKPSIFANASTKSEEKPNAGATFSFGLRKDSPTSPSSTDEKPKALTGFSFGAKSDSSATPSTFTATGSSGFSFSGGKPFSFGNIQPPPAAEAPKDNENGDEEDEPPKVEFKAVVEEDNVYSHRCKVFVKHDGNFADRGVGTLYLKPVKDSDKIQLLVRADTNLGNILVNLILNDSIPTQRMGKNNVMLVCIPTPETEKPTPMLLRVKTSEEADELLATIDKYKKKN